MRRIFFTVGAFAIAGLMLAHPQTGIAQENSAPHVFSQAEAAAIIKSRQSNLKEIAANMKAIADAVQSGHAGDPTLAARADAIASLSRYLLSWFPAGSGPESGNDTGALPAIWQYPDNFGRAGANFQSAAAALDAAVPGKDPAAIGAALKNVGATCAACHKEFRKPL